MDFLKIKLKSRNRPINIEKKLKVARGQHGAGVDKMAEGKWDRGF